MCKAITRRRETVNSVEESIIDHVIISDDLLDDLESVTVVKQVLTIEYLKLRRGLSRRLMTTMLLFLSST